MTSFDQSLTLLLPRLKKIYQEFGIKVDFVSMVHVEPDGARTTKGIAIGTDWLTSEDHSIHVKPEEAKEKIRKEMAYWKKSIELSGGILSRDQARALTAHAFLGSEPELEEVLGEIFPDPPNDQIFAPPEEEGFEELFEKAADGDVESAKEFLKKRKKDK